MTNAMSAPMPAADIGTRFSAFMVDAVLLFSAQWLVFIVLSRQLQAVGLTTTEPCDTSTASLCEGPSTALWVILLLFLLASTVGYYAVFEGRFGATPGKRWMGLRVVESSGTSPIGMTAGLTRAVIRQSFWLSLFFTLEVSPLSLGLPAILFLVLPALTLVVFIVGAVRADGRALHDMAANTLVVRLDQVDINAPDPDATPAPTTRPTSSADEENAEESV